MMRRKLTTSCNNECLVRWVPNYLLKCKFPICVPSSDARLFELKLPACTEIDHSRCPIS